jgi:hypothetical protein
MNGSAREWGTCECEICIYWTERILARFSCHIPTYTLRALLLHVSDKAVESACWTRIRCPWPEAATVAPVQCNRPSGGRRNQKRPAATRCFTHESQKRHAQNFANQHVEIDNTSHWHTRARSSIYKTRRRFDICSPLTWNWEETLLGYDIDV